VPFWQAQSLQDFENYVMAMSEQDKHPRTIRRHLSALRRFYQFMLRQGWVEDNPVQWVQAPKSDKPLPKSVSVDKMQQLLDQPIDSDLAVRDQAMFELLYSSGIRVAELVSLRYPASLAQMDGGYISVVGKGNKQRLAMVGRSAMQAVQAWLPIRQQWACKDDALFISQQGKGLTVRSVQKRLAQRGQSAGLDSRISPHRLRHACATHVLESSGDLRAVQELLGHAQLSTTQIYTKLDMQHLAQVYDQAHPRARKGAQVTDEYQNTSNTHRVEDNTDAT
jgi:integrase/recombinase XerC